MSHSCILHVILYGEFYKNADEDKDNSLHHFDQSTVETPFIHTHFNFNCVL